MRRKVLILLIAVILAGCAMPSGNKTTNENVVYGSADQLKVYKSVDGGMSFSPVPGDLQAFIGH